MWKLHKKYFISWYTHFLVVFTLLKQHCFIILVRFVCSRYPSKSVGLLADCKRKKNTRRVEKRGSKNWMVEIHRIVRHVRGIGLERLFFPHHSASLLSFLCSGKEGALLLFSHLTTSSTWDRNQETHGVGKGERSLLLFFFLLENRKKYPAKILSLQHCCRCCSCLNRIRDSKDKFITFFLDYS